MERWLSIVGIGEDGVPGLGRAAREAIASAEILFGAERHLNMLKAEPLQGPDCRLVPWTTPFREAVGQIAAWRGHKVAVLATGNPMYFGIGSKLVRDFPLHEMRILPAPSVFALACARLGWNQADTRCLSAHGRPVEAIVPALAPGLRLLILTSDGTTPRKLAALLCRTGQERAFMGVLEHLGGEKEHIRAGIADDWKEAADCADLNIVAVECVTDPSRPYLPPVPGLPDDAFAHDGQLTKREIRAVTLAKLGPAIGQHLWDVGAGCGSVAIEWARLGQHFTATAIERQARRCALIDENRLALGAPQVEVVEGEAPTALQGLRRPDAVFLGGGCSRPGLLEHLYECLKQGGRLVANAVTLEGEAALSAFYRHHGGKLCRLSVSHGATIGAYHGWKPARAVTQLEIVKS